MSLIRAHCQGDTEAAQQHLDLRGWERVPRLSALTGISAAKGSNVCMCAELRRRRCIVVSHLNRAHRRRATAARAAAAAPPPPSVPWSTGDSRYDVGRGLNQSGHLQHLLSAGTHRDHSRGIRVVDRHCVPSRRSRGKSVKLDGICRCISGQCLCRFLIIIFLNSA